MKDVVRHKATIGDPNGEDTDKQSEGDYEPVTDKAGKIVGSATKGGLRDSKSSFTPGGGVFTSLKDQLQSDEVKAILASKDCPKARTFGEMIPLAYTISKKNIQTFNSNLCHLPYDKYRVIRDDGTEELPPDVYASNYSGRVDFAREVLECNMRNLVRLKIMEKLGINQYNVNETLDHKIKRIKVQEDYDATPGNPDDDDGETPGGVEDEDDDDDGETPGEYAGETIKPSE